MVAGQGLGLWRAVARSSPDLDQGINYNILITEAAFPELGRTALISVTSLILEFLIGLGLATLFLKAFPAKRVFFTALLTPMMIMPVVVGYTWFMLLQFTGPVNQVLSWIAGGQVDLQWLNTGLPAFFAVVMTEVWHWTPLFS
jgi:multiple sugar transport system permease protein